MNIIEVQYKTSKGAVITITAKVEGSVERESITTAMETAMTPKRQVVKTTCHVTVEKNGMTLKEWEKDGLPSVDRPTLEHVRKALAEKGAAAYFGQVLVREEDAQTLEKIIEEIKLKVADEYHRLGEKTASEKIEEEEIELAERIVKQAEKQKKVYSEAEIEAMKKRYNDAMNEGGEGYVPSFGVSAETLAWAKEKLAKQDEKEIK